MTDCLQFEQVSPGVFRCPAFLSAIERRECLSAIYTTAKWERAALGKYVDNEVATSLVDLALRDVEVANGEGMSLNAIRSKESMILDYLGGLGYRIDQFSRFMVSRYLPGCHIRSHRDTNAYNTIRMFTVVSYLDDKFTGGEIFFPRLSYSYKPLAGDLLFFFSEHEHGVSPVLSGVRHSVVWFAENFSIRERI